MNTNLRIYGTLYIEAECERCGDVSEVKQYYDCNDWLTGYDIDITLSGNEIKESLEMRGWREINGKFLCPDCVAELNGE